ncbi:MAG: hypothetical protein AB3N23_10270 [Paracoccaceae bacterium]
MPQFIFAYHGGGAPDTPEEGEKVMAAWMAWFGGMGDKVVQPGNPVGMSKTVSSSGVADDGGANPLSGYSVVSAGSIEAACDMAAGCPIISDGGSVEVAELMEM